MTPAADAPAETGTRPRVEGDREQQILDATLDVLADAIEHGRLVPAALGKTLGQLLTQEFAPVPRLTDVLAPARALGSRPDDALRQLLEALLLQLPATPPRQTAKLLVAYADLAARTRQPVPAAVQARLCEWSTSATLKKAAAPLLQKRA